MVRKLSLMAAFMALLVTMGVAPQLQRAWADDAPCDGSQVDLHFCDVAITLLCTSANQTGTQCNKRVEQVHVEGPFKCKDFQPGPGKVATPTLCKPEKGIDGKGTTTACLKRYSCIEFTNNAMPPVKSCVLDKNKNPVEEAWKVKHINDPKCVKPVAGGD
ncbi:MAG: hypothetical protein ACRCZF_08990 [Gemmataceae bacterium]